MNVPTFPERFTMAEWRAQRPQVGMEVGWESSGDEMTGRIRKIRYNVVEAQVNGGVDVEVDDAEVMVMTEQGLTPWLALAGFHRVSPPVPQFESPEEADAWMEQRRAAASGSWVDRGIHDLLG